MKFIKTDDVHRKHLKKVKKSWVAVSSGIGMLLALTISVGVVNAEEVTVENSNQISQTVTDDQISQEVASYPNLDAAYEDAPSWAGKKDNTEGKEYIEDKVIHKDDSTRYRTWHGDHYHYNRIDRLTDTEVKAADYILDHNRKEIAQTIEDNYNSLPEWAKNATKEVTDENGNPGYLVNGQFQAADNLTDEQKSALSENIRHYRSDKLQEAYKQAPAYKRVEQGFTDKDGNKLYAFSKDGKFKHDGGVEYDYVNENDLSTSEKEAVDYILDYTLAEEDNRVQRAYRRIGRNNWVDSVEYTERDDNGNFTLYTYTRNNQTHRLTPDQLDQNNFEPWATGVILKNKAFQEDSAYIQAVFDGPSNASEVDSVDKDGNYNFSDGSTTKATDLTDKEKSALDTILQINETRKIRDAFYTLSSQDNSKNRTNRYTDEYVLDRIIYDGEEKIRTLHAYEDAPELNHYHHYPITRYSDEQLDAIMTILQRNKKQLAKKLEDSYQVAPSWIDQAVAIDKDGNYLDKSGNILGKVSTQEEKEAADHIVQTNNDNKLQEAYRNPNTPWARYIEDKIIYADGSVKYKYDENKFDSKKEPNPAYVDASTLTEEDIELLDHALYMDSERQKGIQERSYMRAGDFVDGLITGRNPNRRGFYQEFAYVDSTGDISYKTGDQLAKESSNRSIANSLSRILDYEDKKYKSDLEKLYALAPDWASSIETVQTHDKLGDFYSYTRNYKTIPVSKKDLDADVVSVIDQILEKEAQKERNDYLAALAWPETPIWADEIVEKVDSGYKLEDGIIKNTSDLDEETVRNLDKIAKHKESKALEQAYSQGPTWLSREYMEKIAIFNGEERYLALHGYEDTPEMDHYHSRAITRFNDEERAAIEYVMKRNQKQLDNKLEDAYAVAPSFAKDAYFVDEGNYYDLEGNIIQTGSLTNEEKEAADYIAKVNRENYQQALYKKYPEWVRFIEERLNYADGAVTYLYDENKYKRGAESNQQEMLVEDVNLQKNLDFLVRVDKHRNKRNDSIFRKSFDNRTGDNKLGSYFKTVERSTNGDIIAYVFEDADGKEFKLTEDDEKMKPLLNSHGLITMINYAEKSAKFKKLKDLAKETNFYSDVALDDKNDKDNKVTTVYAMQADDDNVVVKPVAKADNVDKSKEATVTIKDIKQDIKEIKISKVDTDGDLVLYKFEFMDKDGNPVKFKGEAVVTLPIPSGRTVSKAFHLTDLDSEKNYLEFTVNQDGYAVIDVNTFSYYGLELVAKEEIEQAEVHKKADAKASNDSQKAILPETGEVIGVNLILGLLSVTSGFNLIRKKEED